MRFLFKFTPNGKTVSVVFAFTKLKFKNKMTNQLEIFPQGTANIADDRVLATGHICRKCMHNEGWQCNSQVFHYCKARRSNRTSNGLLKIKCKDKACNLFEPFR